MARYDPEASDAERLGKLITAAGLVEWMWMAWCIGAERHLTGVHNARAAYKHKSERDKVLTRWKQACPNDRRDVATRVEETLKEANRALREYRDPFAHCGAMPDGRLFNLASDEDLDLDLLASGESYMRDVAAKLHELPLAW